MDRFERFTFLIFSITRYWNRIATDEMRQHDLKGAYAMYFLVLMDLRDGPTAGQLAEITQRDKADVSRAIAALQKRGYIEPYGESKYRAPIFLTKKGMEMAKRVKKTASDALREAGQGISRQMGLEMYRALEIIADHMKEIYASGKEEVPKRTRKKKTVTE